MNGSCNGHQSILSRFHSVVKRMSSPKELVAMDRFSLPLGFNLIMSELQ